MYFFQQNVSSTRPHTGPMITFSHLNHYVKFFFCSLQRFAQNASTSLQCWRGYKED